MGDASTHDIGWGTLLFLGSQVLPSHGLGTVHSRDHTCIHSLKSSKWLSLELASIMVTSTKSSDPWVQQLLSEHL